MVFITPSDFRCLLENRDGLLSVIPPIVIMPLFQRQGQGIVTERKKSILIDRFSVPVLGSTIDPENEFIPRFQTGAGHQVGQSRTKDQAAVFLRRLAGSVQ